MRGSTALQEKNIAEPLQPQQNIELGQEQIVDETLQPFNSELRDKELEELQKQKEEIE